MLRCFCTRGSWVRLMMVVLMVGAIGGCGSRVKTQRDALYARTQEQQSQLADARTALEQAEAERARLAAQRAELQEQLAARPANPFGGIEGVDVEQGQGQIAVRVPGDVLFAPGKAELQSAAQETLQEVAGVIQQQYPEQIIRVEGHTDTDPIRQSRWRDNLQLSIARAASVERFLEQQGISSDRMYSSGFGASQPRETKAQSRRVEIVVILQGEQRAGGNGASPVRSGGGVAPSPSSPFSAPAAPQGSDNRPPRAIEK